MEIIKTDKNSVRVSDYLFKNINNCTNTIIYIAYPKK